MVSTDARHKAKEDKMVFFTEPCWDRGKEKSGAVHKCLMAHRQQK